MCNWSEAIKEMSYKEGVEKGIENGIEQGIEEGCMEGRRTEVFISVSDGDYTAELKSSGCRWKRLWRRCRRMDTVCRNRYCNQTR